MFNSLPTVVSGPLATFESGRFSLSTLGQNLDARLFIEYRRDHQSIVGLNSILESNRNLLQSYFFSGYMSVETFEKAQHQLRADYWLKFFEKSGVEALMSTQDFEKHRSDLKEGHNDVVNIDFTEDNAAGFISDFSREVEEIFAKRIDGIFQRLSGEHVTNAPQAFGETMIFSAVSRDVNKHSNTAFIHDLRIVLSILRGVYSKFDTQTTQRIVTLGYEHAGKWHSCDGGSFEIKVFKKGTAHLRISQVLAEKLNAVLASLYPNTLAPIVRKTTNRLKSRLQPVEKMLSLELRNQIASTKIERPLEVVKGTEDYPRPQYNRSTTEWKISYYLYKKEAHLKAELISLFGDIATKFSHYGTNLDFIFDFDPTELVHSLQLSGLVPDQVSHQFYQTTDRLRDLVRDLIGDTTNLSCLEPSAGYGKLAQLLPPETTTCVEINSHNVQVLRSRGYDAIQADFVEYAQDTDKRFDLVVMNPPFAKQSYLQHFDLALGLVKAGGRAVAILPSTFKSKLDELSVKHDADISVIYDEQEQFEGTGLLNVVIVEAIKSTVL